MVSARFVDFARFSLLPPLASPPFPVVELPFPWDPVAEIVGLDFDMNFAAVASFDLASSYRMETPMPLLGFGMITSVPFYLNSSCRPECHFEEVGDRTQSCERMFLIVVEFFSSPSPGETHKVWKRLT